uniref:hypothetical protein n=1 Tax=Eisenbergiella sp. TaxID=1924109 RepID=UPI003FEE3439
MNAAKIVEVESDGSVFAPYLIGKEVPPEKGYKEVDFLERRMECLTRKEQQVFQEALEMEHPETLEEMVNLSCNLDKFELLEDGKVIRTGEVLDTVYDSEPLPDVGYEKDLFLWKPVSGDRRGPSVVLWNQGDECICGVFKTGEVPVLERRDEKIVFCFGSRTSGKYAGSGGNCHAAGTV